MNHILDRPVWNALNTRHAALALGNGLAKRYVPSIHPFASSRDESPESLRALAEIATPGEMLILLQADEFVPPPGFAVTTTAFGVQMVAERHIPCVEDDRIVSLGEADAAAMMELATLTRPGPFTPKALSLGDFWGIKEDGRLLAMAGERLKQDGFTELSGVATHPDVRGRGLGRLRRSMWRGKSSLRATSPSFTPTLPTRPRSVCTSRSASS